MSGSSDEQKNLKKTVRKRARRASAAGSERATRSSVSRRTKTPVRKKTAVESPPPIKEEKQPEEKRKAPTSFQSSKSARNRIRNRNIILASVMISGIASSAAVGFTDEGQIDVNQAIESRNERVRSNVANNIETDEDTTYVVPVQNSNNLPNSGLIGLGMDNRPPPTPPPEPVSTTTATTSAAVSTSTEEIIEDEEDAEMDTVEESDVENQDTEPADIEEGISDTETVVEEEAT